MKNNRLGAIEALLCNAHELTVDAVGECADAGDTVRQQRIEQLAQALAVELADVRLAINPKRRMATR